MLANRTWDRVDDLLATMTVEEKVAQLTAVGLPNLMTDGKVDTQLLQEHLQHGIGHVSQLTMLGPEDAHELVELRNAIQRHLVQETRLGIPAMFHAEALSGLMYAPASSFPTAIALAASWEPELVEEMCTVVREQMRALGLHHALSPVLDVARDARWGRVHETYGEDPLLCSVMGVAFVRGLQGDDLSRGVIATGKHFLGHALSEGARNSASVSVAERELYDVFARPFEAAIREAGLDSVMNSYSEVNGVPPAASRALLTDLLRNRLGFDGHVVADYDAVVQLVDRHGVAADRVDAARQALEAGLDVELPHRTCHGDELVEAVKSGAVDISVVETSLRRVLSAKLRVGLFDEPYADARQFLVTVDRPSHRRLARDLAVRSTVLLKNEAGLLPLRKDLGVLAVIGPNADSVRNLFSGYTAAVTAEVSAMMANAREIGAVMTNATALTETAPAGVEDAVRALYPDTRTVLAAVRDAVSASTDVVYAQGCTVNGASREGLADAVAAARGADVAILVLGDKTGWVLDATSGEGRDRASLELPGCQEELLSAVCETGTPVVVVLVNGRPAPVGVPGPQPGAVLEAWQPGAVGADHIAEILFGDQMPSGKLPITFPRSAGQCPTYHYHRAGSGYGTPAVMQDYTDVPTSPAYAFGHGLSYTEFIYRRLVLSATAVPADGAVDVVVELANTGARPGEEVVQLYAHTSRRGIVRPVHELVGFKRVRLDPGQTCVVTFHLDLAQLACLDAEMELSVEPGTVTLWAGGASDDLPLSSTFQIVGPAVSLPRRTVFAAPASVTAC